MRFAELSAWAFAPALLLCAQCHRPESPGFSKVGRAVTLEPGRVYRLDFANAPDQAPIGTEWSGDRLAGSAFEHMDRPAIVIKADDYGDPLDESTKALITWLESKGRVASFGVITSRLAKSRSTIPEYRELMDRGFELWFHGHSHWLDGDRGEFRGRTLEEQESSFKEGLKLGSDLLGVEFTAFGAPGNAIDETTPLAIRNYPGLKVWLFGPKDSPIASYPRLAELEAAVGKVGTLEDLLPKFERALTVDAQRVVLQCHPHQWTHEDVLRAEEILDRMCERADCRFSTPTAEWRWEQERAKVHLKKLSATALEIDLRQGTMPQKLEAATADFSVAKLEAK